MQLVPVILSGGTGTRLWPRSRARHPKQFLHLDSPDASLIGQTLARVRDRNSFAPPIVVANEEHRFLVAEELRLADITDAAILLEPCGRNTAPALALAAQLIRETYGNALMLVLPSDHILRDEVAFFHAVEQAAEVAEQGCLVTFGVTPERPETGFGYIKRGQAIAGTQGHGVERFVEKPDGKTAETYLADGGYLWNSGMFLFPAELYLKELGTLQPAIAQRAEVAMRRRTHDLGFLRPDAKLFQTIPSLSIDYAVMELTDKAAVVPLDAGWNDAGSWDALWHAQAKDHAGNVATGEVTTQDVRGCYLAAGDGVVVAALGVEDLVVVSTRDCVLVADRSRAQDIRGLVEKVGASRPELLTGGRQEYRPWGHYKTVDAGARHQVKHITVKPGGRLSLQMHRHRAEHWIVLRGRARVTRDGEAFTVTENESVFIPAGSLHRIENPSDVPLEIIEVQTGDHLAEDDIVRFEDSYGRANALLKA